MTTKIAEKPSAKDEQITRLETIVVGLLDEVTDLKSDVVKLKSELASQKGFVRLQHQVFQQQQAFKPLSTQQGFLPQSQIGGLGALGHPLISGNKVYGKSLGHNPSFVARANQSQQAKQEAQQEAQSSNKFFNRLSKGFG